MSAADVARRVLAEASSASVKACLDELMTLRELAFNFCLRNARLPPFSCAA
jgi:hypothetical protein